MVVRPLDNEIIFLILQIAGACVTDQIFGEATHIFGDPRTAIADGILGLWAIDDPDSVISNMFDQGILEDSVFSFWLDAGFYRYIGFLYLYIYKQLMCQSMHKIVWYKNFAWNICSVYIFFLLIQQWYGWIIDAWWCR